MVTPVSDELIHVLNERISTDNEMSSTMWCGFTTVELFDGTFFSQCDFFLEAQAAFATCPQCLKAIESDRLRAKTAEKCKHDDGAAARDESAPFCGHCGEFVADEKSHCGIG